MLRHSAGAAPERVPLRSPATGVVLKRLRESEGPVQTGEPLLEVGDPRQLEVVAELLSADAVRVRPGMRVLFRRWGGDGALEGRVRRVEPAGYTKISALGVEEQRVNVVADFVPAPAQRPGLGDGYRVEAAFVLWQEPAVLQLPASALFQRGEGWSVFVVEGGRAHRRDVVVGQRNGLAAQVVSGVAEGEHVITHPDNVLEHGARVTLR